MSMISNEVILEGNADADARNPGANKFENRVF